MILRFSGLKAFKSLTWSRFGRAGKPLENNTFCNKHHRAGRPGRRLEIQLGELKFALSAGPSYTEVRHSVN
jgi:hypothetical protein